MDGLARAVPGWCAVLLRRPRENQHRLDEGGTITRLARGAQRNAARRAVTRLGVGRANICVRRSRVRPRDRAVSAVSPYTSAGVHRRLRVSPDQLATLLHRGVSLADGRCDDDFLST